MNTELLREDERVEICDSLESMKLLVAFFRQRLIEEREKNADLNQELNSLSDGLREIEADLAEERKDSERLDWLFIDRATIDAAMKEGK